MTRCQCSSLRLLGKGLYFDLKSGDKILLAHTHSRRATLKKVTNSHTAAVESIKALVYTQNKSMPIVDVPQFNDNKIYFNMNEPLRWNTDTLQGTCGGFIFKNLTNGSGTLTAEDIAFLNQCARIPDYFIITRETGLVVNMFLNFSSTDTRTGVYDERKYHLKANGLDYWTAFLMASHTRLGAESPARGMGTDLTRMIHRAYSRD